MTDKKSLAARGAFPGSEAVQESIPMPSWVRARFGEPRSLAEKALMEDIERLDAKARSETGLVSRHASSRVDKYLNRLIGLRDRDRLWGAAEPLLRHTAELLGLSGDEAAQSARISALLALPALCRRDGIRVSFTKSASTDGRVIWLGPIDLSHPAAPVYIFGHGVHERSHVLHTEFAALRAVENRMRTLTNLIEDIRVDMRGIVECKGYALWREALIAMLCSTGHCSLAVSARQRPAEVFCGWLHAELTREYLKLKLPEGVLEATRAAAREVFGEEFLDEALGLAKSRYPLKDTDDAVTLAREFFELFRHAAKLEQSAIDAWQAGEAEAAMNLAGAAMSEAFAEDGDSGESRPDSSEEGGESDGRKSRSKPSDRRNDRRSPGGEGVQLSLFEAAAGSGKSAQVRIAGEEGGENPFHPAIIELAEDNDWEHMESEFDRSLAMAELQTLIGQNLGTFVPVDEVEETRGETFEAAKNAAKGTAKKGSMLPRGCSAEAVEEARRAFDRVWEKSSAIAFSFADVMRRNLPAMTSGATSGFDFDDALIDRALTGDDRIFLAEGREIRRECACQLLVDLSGSLGIMPGAVVRCAAARLEEAFKRTPGIRCRTAVFPDLHGDRPFLVSDWNDPAAKTRALLRDFASRGPTPVSTALLWAFETLLMREEPHKLLIVLTDGIFDRHLFAGEIALLKDAGIETATVILRDRASPLFIEGEDGAGFGDETRSVDSADEIPQAVISILRAWRAKGAFGR